MAPKSPIDTAKPDQIVWDKIAPVFEATRVIYNPSYVYFIGEEDEGFIKIGKAQDPIKRLKQMQVGNPRRLRVERMLIGDIAVEKLIQQLWQGHAVVSNESKRRNRIVPGTEWFRPEIRTQLYPIVDEAIQRQIDVLENVESDVVELAAFERCVRQAHIDADHEAKVVAPTYKLGHANGYAVSHGSRI